MIPQVAPEAGVWTAGWRPRSPHDSGVRFRAESEAEAYERREREREEAARLRPPPRPAGTYDGAGNPATQETADRVRQWRRDVEAWERQTGTRANV